MYVKQCELLRTLWRALSTGCTMLTGSIIRKLELEDLIWGRDTMRSRRIPNEIFRILSYTDERGLESNSDLHTSTEGCGMRQVHGTSRSVTCLAFRD